MKRRRRSPAQAQTNHTSQIDNHLRGKEHVGDLAWWSFKAIKWIGAALFIFFGWLQVNFIPVLGYAQNTTPEALMKVTLFLYYWCWIGGCGFETWMQQKVYVEDPKRGEVTLNLIAAIIAMGVAAFALIWASSHQQFFSLILLGFTVVNIVGWWSIVRRVRPVIDASRTKLLLSAAYFRIEQLKEIEGHITGNWQIKRFAAMIIISLCSILIYYAMPPRLFVANLVQLTPLTIDSTTASNLLAPIVYLTFVLVAEGWIWAKRARIWATLSTTDRLRNRYTLTPLP